MTARLLAVIPAFNEEATVGDVVRGLLDAGIPPLVIDDGSADNTAVLALEAGAEVVRLPINLGVGGALRVGWRWAVDHGYEAAVQVDADGQHVPDEIARLVAFAESEDLDLAIGSRFAEGGLHPGVGAIRWRAMRLLGFVLRRFGGVTVTDPTSGFRVVRGPLLPEFARNFPQYYVGDTFEATLVAARRNYRIGEIGITMLARQGGTPSANTGASVRAMVRALAVLVTGTSVDFRDRSDAEQRSARQ